ncbi:MAG: hypothetical protein IJM41_06945 [Bacteroidales bacterium]|nr:hypothetical protein [Bacteroidales bacterium]
MKRRLLIIIITLCCGICICRAQERFEWCVIGYAEEQFCPDNGRFNSMAVLDYAANIGLWKGGTLQFEGLSVAKEHKLNYMSDDIVIYTNLECEANPFSIGVLGLSQQIGPVKLFAGIRNLYPDFFNEREFLYFIGSSHVLHPVLWRNYDIPSAPTSAMMAMAEWQINDQFVLKTTFYNAQTADRPSRQFRLGGGLRNLTSLTRDDGMRKSTAGATVGPDFYGGHGLAMYLTHIEHFNERLEAFLEASHFFGKEGNSCRNYLGIGSIYNFNGKNLLGACANLTGFRSHDDNCYQMEFNYARVIGPVMLQPILSMLHRYGNWHTMAFLRLTIELSSKQS